MKIMDHGRFDRSLKLIVFINAELDASGAGRKSDGSVRNAPGTVPALVPISGNVEIIF